MIETTTTTTIKQNPSKRRIEKDQGNRNYKCPCGKTYLSYPALFTHIKQKHDGKAPGEIGKPKGNNKGRPPSKKLEEKLQNNNTSILSGLCEYLEAIPQKDNKKIQYLYNLYSDKNQLSLSPSSSSEQPEKIKDKFCKEIFAEVLQEVDNSLPSQSTNMVKQRLTIFLNIWMQHFLQKQKELFGTQPLYTAQFLNEFIMDYLPQYIESKQLSGLKFLKSSHAISIVYSVHNWVFDKKYTADQVFKSPVQSEPQNTQI